MLPAEICVAAGIVRVFIGDHAVSVRPVPSCPNALKPQQYTSPDVSSAHVCFEPAVSAFAGFGSFTARGVPTGVRSLRPREPVWPYLLLPQQNTAPDASSAHECWPPSARDATF